MIRIIKTNPEPIRKAKKRKQEKEEEKSSEKNLLLLQSAATVELAYIRSSPATPIPFSLKCRLHFHGLHCGSMSIML